MFCKGICRKHPQINCLDNQPTAYSRYKKNLLCTISLVQNRLARFGDNATITLKLGRQIWLAILCRGKASVPKISVRSDGNTNGTAVSIHGHCRFLSERVLLCACGQENDQSNRRGQSGDFDEISFQSCGKSHGSNKFYEQSQDFI